MANDLLSLAGWYFLPNVSHILVVASPRDAWQLPGTCVLATVSIALSVSSSTLHTIKYLINDQLVTGWVQSAYYAIWIRAGDPRPQPGSRAYIKHRRTIHMLVIVAYLLYTIYEADYQLRFARDFYQDLGVPHDVDDRGLQSRFRRLTVQFHPDKVSSAEARPAAEAYYVHLKLARDTLIDPAKRFAYDRFGPDILHWRHCTTIRDFVSAGVTNIALYYAATGSVLVVLGIFGYLQQAPYWRYLAMGCLFMFELHAMTRPSYPKLLTKLLNPVLVAFRARPPYLPFQFLSLARKIVMTVFIAITQIGPLLQQSMGPPSADNSAVQGVQLDRLDMIANSADQELSRLLGLELTPFAVDPAAMQELRTAMREWLVNNTLRNDGQVRNALGQALERRRAGAPAGARGTT